MQRQSEIKKHIKSVGDTRKITGAMELISVAKIRKAVSLLNGFEPYLEKITEIFKVLAAVSGAETLKAFSPSQKKAKRLLLVISSDRGLCGGFNSQIIKYAGDVIKEHDCVVFTCGKTAKKSFSSRSVLPEEDFSDFSGSSQALAKAISDKVLSRFNCADVGSFDIIYTHYRPHLPPEITTLPVLPYTASGLGAELICDPGKDEIIESFLPDYLKSVVYGALIRSAAAEHSQRRAAMNTATKNAVEMSDKLNLNYHRARQEKVTEELSEIVSASSAAARQTKK
jgi:F-type H+-transporting ATPase subunit gamma